MRVCHELDAYLDGRLDEEAAQTFEAHLHACSTCRERVEQWYRAAGDLEAWADAVQPPRATEQKAADLVARARTRNRTNRTVRRIAMRPLWALAGSAAVLVFLVGLYFVVSRFSSRANRHRVWAPVHWAVINEILAEGRITRFGSIALVLEGGGRAEAAVSDDLVRVSVVKGTLVAWVRHDSGSSHRGQKLVVEAEGYQIRDVGTRFSVSVDPGRKLSVALLDGRVLVSRPGGKRPGGGDESGPRPTRGGRVAALESSGLVMEADRTLEIYTGTQAAPGFRDAGTGPGGTIRLRIRMLAESERRRITRWSEAGSQAGVLAPQGGRTEFRPSLDAKRTRVRGLSSRRAQVRGGVSNYEPDRVKGLILSGHLTTAASLLKNRLRTHPSDGRAWSMLGDCRRKQGRWTEAVRAYRKAARFGSGSIRRRAVYLAASMLQDRLGRCRAAVALLDEFLAAGGGPLQPEALVRKARCLARMGRRAEALSILRRVETRFGGTTAAVRARRIIKRLGDTRPRGVR